MSPAMSKTYNIAVIPGDGIGKEVTPWAQKALEKAAEGVADFTYEHFDLGAERYLRDGAILPDDELDRIKTTDAILLGAIGDPRTLRHHIYLIDNELVLVTLGLRDG